VQAAKYEMIREPISVRYRPRFRAVPVHLVWVATWHAYISVGPHFAKARNGDLHHCYVAHVHPGERAGD